MSERATLTQLVRAAEQGDQRAWDEIVERFTALLWSVARAHRFEEHLAADVVQSTWLKLVESLPRIQDPEALPGWLLTTARRQALRALPAASRERLDGDLPHEYVDPADPLDTQLLLDERDAHLWRTFARLDERCRRLLRVLCAHNAPGYAQIATELGMPIGSIGPTRARCLDKLRKHLDTQNYDFSHEGGAR